MDKKSLIITADDYGMCDFVNCAIEECIDAGIVTSTNIMPNLASAEAVKNLKHKYPNISLGIHWNLTVGRPITEDNSLMSKSGEFFDRTELIMRIRKGLIKKETVEKELRAQYQKYIELCGVPDYWNTHENIHVDLLTFDIFIRTAKDLNINKMRNHQRVYIEPTDGYTTSFFWRLMNPLKGIILSLWRKKAQKMGIAMPDGLLVFQNENEKFQIANVTDKIKWNNAKIAEFVIHPSINGDHRYFGKITDKRVREYYTFSNFMLKELLMNNNIQVCGFEEV